MKQSALESLAIQSIRLLAVDGVQKANSGHPGLPLGSAPMAYTLFQKHLKHNPAEPDWFDRDRFVLSAGHASMLLYALLHSYGYPLPIEELQRFRQLGSLTPGHPEYGLTQGVETTTGPLGQGFATAVGLALAEAHLAARFNREGLPLIDHHTYCLVGDGCLQEGVSAEAASLAGTLGLGKLIVLYDSNGITIDGSTELAFTEDVQARFAAYDWQTLEVADGNDVQAISEAIEAAKAETARPSLIVVHTQIGYASPLEGSAKCHGAPLGEENVRLLRAKLNWPMDEPFAVPEEVRQHFAQRRSELVQNASQWQKILERYARQEPQLHRDFLDLLSGQAPDLSQDQDFWNFEGKVATRKCSETCINRIGQRFSNWVGGSADLAGSNLTTQKEAGWMAAGDFSGRNIHFGIREFAMACMASGLALHGLYSYCATFLVFSDYMKAAMRLAAIMELPVTYVLTHDSIGLGEDGATHQPIEQLNCLRSMPGIYTWRPADGRECAAAYTHALNSRLPHALALSRQGLPTLQQSGPEALKGAYILAENCQGAEPELILIATGSEVSLALEAYQQLAERCRLRLISMPCMELFLEQSPEYQETLLPRNCRRRLAIEAGDTQAWYRFVGLDGAVIGMESFGLSGKAEELFAHFGFTVEALVARAQELLDR